ncbi:MAG: restriction endonuclease subunit S [Flavipsychrobacter sp.]|nr:restriction endonuclease subunit S [Flavipsychrobacter sp.]
MTQRYSKYKDSGIEWIGEIPEHWEVRKLKFICEINRDTLPENTNPGIKIEYVDIGSVSFINGIEKTEHFTFKSAPSRARRLAKKNDTIVSTVRTYLKAIDFITGEKSNYVYSTGFAILSPRKEIKPRYLASSVRCNFFTGQVAYSSKGMSYPAINPTDLGCLWLLQPPLTEQESIAQFLDEKCARIDEAVRIKEKQIDLLKEYRQIAIHQAVTKGLNDQVKMKDSGIEWIGEIPEHWEVIPLNYIGFTQNGISKGGEYFGKGTPFISYSDVYKNETLPQNINGLVEATSNEMLQYSVEKGDVFFTRTSETVDEIGLSSVALKNFENATFAGFLIRFRFTKNIYLPEFSKYYFRSKTHRTFFVGKMNLVIRASLSQELLKKMPVLIPPLFEQNQIVAHLEALTTKTDEAIHLKEQQIEQLKQYKTSLIDEVVTGKIRVS